VAAPSNSSTVEIVELFGRTVSSHRCDETILLSDETIFRFRADIRKQRLVIKLRNETAHQRLGLKTGDSQMRTISFILAFAFILAGPSIAGSSDSLPGVGTFAYTVAPTVVAAN
jgi:hypothetical protein